MKRVLITGMSGTGKSSVIQALSGRGLSALDTDTDDWSVWQTGEDGPDWVWREDRMARLLAAPPGDPLFVSGCKSNQGQFYDRFEAVVLLTAPLELLLERVAARTTNPYGRSAEERQQITDHVRWVEPLLRRRATLELDTSILTVPQVVDRLLALADLPA
ncbi:AAA family ATPase [Deinococcus sonorensis]|uniref:AAA family ATPase n=2 Tax=Deinococcus sonorensis TaxID=309891 RepID=A0AAU7U7T8_9DEIO